MNISDSIPGFITKHLPWLLTARTSRIASWICLFIILLAISRIGARCFWTFFPDYQDPGVITSGSASGSRGDHNYADDVLTLGFFPVNYEKMQRLKVDFESSSLAGKNSVTENNPASAPSSGSSSSPELPLTITGILASTDPEKSQTVIIYRGAEQLYVEGEVIEGTSARISRIYPDHIEIKYRNEIFSYPFDEESSSLRSASLPSSQGKDTSSGDEKTKSGSQEKTVNKDGLENLEVSARNLLEIVTISPIKKGNEVLGYRLNPGKKPELFAQAGFKNNDMAVMVNGYDLTSQEQTKKLFSEYTTMRNFEITVERDGIRENIYLNVSGE